MDRRRVTVTEVPPSGHREVIRQGVLRPFSCFLTLAVQACSPVIPSLAPGLHDNAVAYHASISDINDQVLLANIVRARDHVPLNVTELSTVTGTLSEQASLGLSIPFGGGIPSTARGVATPSFQASAAPTFNMAALNTRGFTLNIIQPVSPVYVASKWNTGISHELLLMLFVKDIVFADSYARSVDGCGSENLPGGSGAAAPAESDDAADPLVPCHHRFVNDPDSPGEVNAFKAVIEGMLPSVGIKIMTILEPVGPSFPFLGAGKNTADDLRSSKSGVSDQSQTSLEAFALTTHIGDGQYHVGDDDKRPGWGQLYRVYPNQVAVCATDPVKTSDGTFYIYPISADIASARHAEVAKSSVTSNPFAKDWEIRLNRFKAQCAAGTHTSDHACDAAKQLSGRPRLTQRVSAFGSYALVMSAVGGGDSRQSVGEVSARGDGQLNRSEPGAGSSTRAVTDSLQAHRLGAFLRVDDCYADQSIREPDFDAEFGKYTESIGHIEWRSVAEVFQYLGAVLRHQNGITWDVQRDRDVLGSINGGIPESLFMLRRADSKGYRNGKVHTAYAGEEVSIGSGDIKVTDAAGIAERTVDDQSLAVLSLLSELVNSAKISSDIPVTQQLQVLP